MATIEAGGATLASTDSRPDILGLGFADFSSAASRLLRSGKGAAGAIYARAFSAGRVDAEGLGLSEASRRGWESAFRVGLLELRRTALEEGVFGQTIKAVLACEDGTEIECVRIPMPPRADGRPRATLCVSSQVGCRMGCAFCETGRAGFTRNLSAAEIVSELVSVRAVLGWEVGNVVFMGMGEALDNVDEVARALAVLTDPRGVGLSWERITVCTSGVVDGITELRRRGHPRLNLSLSLNAADDDTRSSLMPVNRRWNLDALAQALVAYPRRRNFVLGLNWCLLPGINDSRDDARRVGEFSRRLGPSFINLIPYNPGSQPIARAPTEEELEGFASWLAEEGCHVKRRDTKGGGIMAGCGQLGSRLPST